VIHQESGFRMRGSGEISRIEGFTDAVFAFAVTLLVVSLEVPKTFTELQSMMRGFIAFAIGFALLFYLWYEQYKFFRRYGLSDSITMVLNGLLVFVVLFFVYPLKFLFTFLVTAFTGGHLNVHLHDGTTAPMIEVGQVASMMVVYGVGYISVYAVFAMLYAHALRKRSELDLNELELFDTRASFREALVQVGIGVVSLAFALSPLRNGGTFAGFTYMLIGPVMAANGMVSGRNRRRRFAGS